MIISTFASLTVVFNSRFILLSSPLTEVGPAKIALPCSSFPRAHFCKLQLKCFLLDLRQIWCSQSNDLHQSTYFITVRDLPQFALPLLLLIVKAISIPLHIYFLNVENEFKNYEFKTFLVISSLRRNHWWWSSVWSVFMCVYLVDSIIYV